MRGKILTFRSFIVIFAILTASFWTLGMFPPPENATKSTPPVIATERSTTREDAVTNDTFVTRSSPYENSGGLAYLYAGYKYYDLNEIYLYFNITTAPATWTKAEIRLVFDYISNPFNMNVSLVTDAWKEMDLDWNNKPPYGTSIATVALNSASVTYTVNVTEFITRGGSSFSVCLNASEGSVTEYAHMWACESSEIEAPGARLVWTFTEDASITVTSPTSDSDWRYGTFQTINWTSVGTIPYVLIQLYKGATKIANYSDYLYGDELVLNNGSIEIIIDPPANLLGDDFRIKITDGSDADIYDFSDNFSVVPNNAIPGYDAWLIVGFLLSTVALIALTLRRTVLKKTSAI